MYIYIKLVINFYFLMNEEKKENKNKSKNKNENKYENKNENKNKNEDKNKNKKKIDIIEIINNSETIINKYIYLFLIILFKNIFLKKQNRKGKNDKCDDFISHINTNIIKDVDKFISKEYNLKNIKNILDFAKSQNLIFCGDIIENILIYIFSLGFKVDKDATFGQFLYNNINTLRDPYNYDILNMIKSDIFAHEELRNLKKLLEVDITFNEMSNDLINELQIKSVFYNLLIDIYKMKYKFLWKENYDEKVLNYIHKGNFNMKIYEKIFNLLKESSSTVLEQDLTANSINSFVSNLFYPTEFGQTSKASIRIVRSFLISVFIYYQNKNSPLMNYINPNENKDNEKKEMPLVLIPFTYELSGAMIEGRFSNIVFSPLKIEPRISNIVLDKNNLRELGQYESAKLIIMNKNIKLIDLNTSLLRTNYLEYFNFGMGLHDNYTLEELDLSYNYLKENSEESMYKIISHLKGLKTINLSANEFRKGLSSFFVVLRKLYRKGKSKLENLYLNKCMLDGQSLYELGELVKCKFCKLKRLSLNGNSFPYNNNDFLKKLKKNKSLVEIYLNRNDIWNYNVDDILRIMNVTGIKYLYLYRIKITDFNKLLTIIYRTKLIGNQDDKNKINLDELFLTNLDLSNNDFSIKNQKHIELLTKIIEKTNLNCLDISHILYDINPDRVQKIKENLNYRTKVEALKKISEEKKNDYLKYVRDLNVNMVDKRRNENLEDKEILEKYDTEIDDILTNKRSEHTVFLDKQARRLINNKENEEIRKNKEEFYNMVEKLKKYMIYKRSEGIVNKLEKEVKKKKLILI